MTEFVRVRAENGDEISLPAEFAEVVGLKPLKKSAYGLDGQLLPTKPRVPLGGASAEDNEAPGSKEN